MVNIRSKFFSFFDKTDAAEVLRVKHKLNLADAITASRIVFAVFLLFCSAFSVLFYLSYLLGALSDLTDGWVARKRNLASSFGAKLDTVADFVFVAAVLIKTLPALTVPGWLWIWVALIALLKLINLITSLVMFRRLVPMHTPMNKITGFLLFLLPFGVGRVPWQVLAAAVIVSCSAATFAAIQEGHFIRTGKEFE